MSGYRTRPAPIPLNGTKFVWSLNFTSSISTWSEWIDLAKPHSGTANSWGNSSQYKDGTQIDHKQWLGFSAHPQPNVATASPPPLLMMNRTAPTDHTPPPCTLPPNLLPKETPTQPTGLPTIPSSTSNQEKETTPIRPMSIPPRCSSLMERPLTWQTSDYYDRTELSNRSLTHSWREYIKNLGGDRWQ